MGGETDPVRLVGLYLQGSRTGIPGPCPLTSGIFWLAKVYVCQSPSWSIIIVMSSWRIQSE